MNDRRTYQIRIEGQADEGEINAASPVRVTVARAGEAGTVVQVCTDQSGLVGLIRRLHGLGFVLLSIQVQQAGLQAGCDHTPGVSRGLEPRRVGMWVITARIRLDLRRKEWYTFARATYASRRHRLPLTLKLQTRALNSAIRRI